MTCPKCEDAADLAGTDTLANIARRLGFTAPDDARLRDHLLKHLRRHHRHDLANRLNRIEQGARV